LFCFVVFLLAWAAVATPCHRHFENCCCGLGGPNCSGFCIFASLDTAMPHTGWLLLMMVLFLHYQGNGHTGWLLHIHYIANNDNNACKATLAFQCCIKNTVGNWWYNPTTKNTQHLPWHKSWQSPHWAKKDMCKLWQQIKPLEKLVNQLRCLPLLNTPSPPWL